MRTGLFSLRTSSINQFLRFSRQSVVTRLAKKLSKEEDMKLLDQKTVAARAQILVELANILKKGKKASA